MLLSLKSPEEQAITKQACQDELYFNTQHLFCGKPMRELLAVNCHSSLTPSSLVSPPTTVVSPWGDQKHS